MRLAGGRADVHSIGLFWTVELEAVAHAAAVHGKAFGDCVGSVRVESWNRQAVPFRIPRVGDPPRRAALLFSPRKLKRADLILPPAPCLEHLRLRGNGLARVHARAAEVGLCDEAWRNEKRRPYRKGGEQRSCRHQSSQSVTRLRRSGVVSVGSPCNLRGDLPIQPSKSTCGVPMRFAVLLVAAFQAAPALSAQHIVPSSGHWLIERGDHSGTVQLTVRYGEGRYSSNWGRDVPVSELVGLSAADMGGSGTTVHFKIVRSAGTLDCEGWFNDGKGSGHFTYQPNPDFVAELAKRGINAPTDWEQFQMTMAGVGLDLVDELARQKYDRPTAAELARMGTHGVDLEYVRDIGARGYHLGDSESLIRMRDHGVDPEFIESLDSAGYKNLGAQDLVRLRDHGVNGDYIADMKDAGYAPANPEELVQSRDHGVDPSYIRSLKEAGYGSLSLEQLRRARDHGVTRGFIERVKARGYGAPSLEEVIRLRDRGLE